MKNIITVLCIASSIWVSAQNVWNVKANFSPGNRGECAGFAIGTNGFIMTGYDGTKLYQDVWTWSQSLDQWNQKSNFGGVARRAASAVSLNGYGFIMGGKGASAFLADIWKYSPNTDTWQQKTSFPGYARYRALAIADTVNGIIYYTCGDRGATTYLSDFWCYNTKTDTWKQLKPFPGGQRAGPSGFYLNGMIYMGTGNNNDQIFEATYDWWKYNPVDSSWTQVTGLPRNAERRHAVTFTIAGRGYICLGDSTSASGTSAFLNDLWMYDAFADTWTQEANYGGIGAALSVGYSIGVKGYVGTGATSAYTNEYWEYAPSPQDTILGIPQVENPSIAINLYPNPAIQNICINHSPIGKEAVLTITDILGNKILSRTINGSQNIVSIDISGFSSGMYFVEIISLDKYSPTLKFIKE